MRSSTLARWTSAAAVCAALVILRFSIPASASLGGDVSSVQTDRARMQGALTQITHNTGYDVHEMRAAAGTTVREFVSSAGTVFGVAWQGPAVPDLRQILGTYFAAYTQAAQAARAKRVGHRPLLIDNPDFVVEQSGHQRAFVGRAYVPRLVPAGVLPDVVR